MKNGYVVLVYMNSAYRLRCLHLHGPRPAFKECIGERDECFLSAGFQRSAVGRVYSDAHASFQISHQRLSPLIHAHVPEKFSVIVYLSENYISLLAFIILMPGYFACFLRTDFISTPFFLILKIPRQINCEQKQALYRASDAMQNRFQHRSFIQPKVP